MRLEGLEGGAAALVAAPPHWPPLHIVEEVADAPPATERVTAHDAVLPLSTGGHLTLDRARRTARFTVPREMTAAALVHPFLAPAAAVFAHWDRRLTFHAGAFVAGGGVWAVAGHREAGKSTTLARLAMLGHEVFADDVLVVHGGLALAGPRAIDLRSGAARRLGVGEALGVVGARERWRLSLPPATAELRFRGWIFLDWGDDAGARPLRASECLRLLTETLTVRLDAPDPGALLALASLPAWVVRRSRDWEQLDAGIDRMLELTA